jgi:chemosensory pili system protein ChpC
MSVKAALLSVLSIPLQNKVLLLPNICIAEIIGFRKPLPVNRAPHWCLGKMSWRGVSIPVISFELLNDETLTEHKSTARLLVFNSVTGNDKLPFFAMVSQNIPRSLKVKADDMVKQAVKVGHAEAMQIMLQNEAMIIPNLDYVENTLVKAKII